MNELFANTQDALVFAFGYSAGQYPQSPMAQMAKTGNVGSGKGLVSTAGAAQAGMIQSALSVMNSIKVQCLVARYAQQYTDCQCCGGRKPEKLWQEAIAALSDWSMQFLAGSISHAVVREAIILNFFSRGVSINEAAERAHVPVKTAYNHRAKIHAALKELDAQAQCEIADLLERHGIVEKTAEIA